MERNRNQQRMFYIRSLQLHILDALYSDAEQVLEKAMWKIADENQIILNARTPTFIYDGRWWPTKDPNNPTKCNRLLHISLYEKVQDLLDRVDFTDVEMRAGIETLISNFLSESGHVSDLERLLPEAIQANMPIVDEEVFNITEPLPDSHIEQMLETNEINVKYLKRLLMTQLLLSYS